MGAVIANGGFLVSPAFGGLGASAGRSENKQDSAWRPSRCLKPQTVMTMRQMMQRVITDRHGTAHRLHLVGYTLAGKTGTAQIFDFAHHIYTHKYNASFVGFAPMNNPSILVIATVSGTTGEAGFGASASGPAVQNVIETALRLREVPRDVPEEVDEIEQKAAARESETRSEAEAWQQR